MTEEEYNFLEVIYNRGSIPEQSYLHFINNSRRSGNSISENETIEKIFLRFQDSGLIDTQNKGVFRITPLGKEKYEEICMRKETSRSTESVSYRRTKSFQPDSRFWLALMILVLIAGIIISTIGNHWDYVMGLLRRFRP